MTFIKKEETVAFEKSNTKRKYGSILIVLAISVLSLLSANLSLLLLGINATRVQEHKGHQENVIYGHIHIAKTAGTTVNGELAMHYERVCGNKGYSYDAFTTNERFKTLGHGKNIKYGGDMFHQLSPNHNRGKVLPAFMDEIGYHDCDWIAVEREWQFWNETFYDWTIPLHLIVPCRDPIDHLMSQCNFFHQPKKWSFHCNKTGDAMIKQVHSCFRFLGKRFNYALKNQFPMKCYDFKRTNDYMNWIGERLQRKRIETEYVKRSTNRARNRENECIWKEPEVRQMITDYMTKSVGYYRFCNECIGSENDILVGKV